MLEGGEGVWVEWSRLWGKGTGISLKDEWGIEVWRRVGGNR